MIKRFISTNKHSPEFVIGMNRIGAIIPSDSIFKSIHLVLKDDAKMNPSHRNDFKIGMASLQMAAKSQGKEGLPKKSLKKDISNDSIEIVVPSYDHRESLAYLALRSTSNFAACQVIFNEIKRRCPDFNPESIIDWGTGTGSVFWSATNVWDNINSATGIDISDSMINIAKKMNHYLKEEGYHDLEPVFKRQISVENTDPADLVVSSFTLSELSSDVARKTALELLWSKTKDVLILIDRGSPYGASIVNSARTDILRWAKAEKTQAYIVSPCPHEKDCPMGKDGIRTWCHFSQRYRISKEIMDKKSVSNNHEDSRYSYVVFRKKKRPEPTITADSTDLISNTSQWPRIVGAPMKRTKHVVLDLCHGSGDLHRIVVPKSQGPIIYKDARKSHWGDLWPHMPKGKVVIKGGNIPQSIPEDDDS